MIRHKKDGLKYAPGNSQELADCLVTLLKDKNLRIEYSNSGRQHILDLANKDRILQQIFELYSMLRGQHGY